ncbi:hypothetical protein ACYJW8_09285 [Frateuria aurantia]
MRGPLPPDRIDPLRSRAADRTSTASQRHRRLLPLAALLPMLVALHPGRAHADAADFQGMPGMWKVSLRIQRTGQPPREKSTWLCADDGSDPMDTFAAVDLPELERCTRHSTHRGTTGLAWRLSCPSGDAGRGRIIFDSAEHYRGQLSLPQFGEQIELEAHHYAACTGPSD